MKISLSYDSSVKASNFSGGASEEAAFKSAMNYVAGEFDSLFTNNVTINLAVGWGEYAGNPIGANALGQNIASVVADTYSTVESALLDTASASHDAIQNAAYATLPSSDPTGGEGVDLSTAEAKALGLFSGSGVDDFVGFNSSATWSFAHGVTPASGAYSFVGTAEHEISEALGRFSLPLSTTAAAYTVMDLFRYKAPGARDTAPGTGGKGSTSYFSYDNGDTNLGLWNNQKGNGDLGDWFPSGPAPQGNDSFNDFSSSGVINALTSNDVALMNVLGWDMAFPPGEIPAGETGWIPSGQVSAGVIVLNGGDLEVGSGGTALGTLVKNGGRVQVDHGGVANTAVIKSGGRDKVEGTDIAAVIDGGTQNVSSGGSAVATTVESGGHQYVFAGGKASSTIIDNNAVAYVSSGGTTSGTLVHSGGSEYVSAGGIASSTAVKNGGVLQIDSGGTARNTVISSGGVDDIFTDGTASHTRINSGGSEVVGFLVSGGTAIGTIVERGGIQYVFGTASSTTLSGGEQDVLSNATAASTIVSSGGHQYVSAGAVANHAIIRSSGVQIDEGLTSGTIVSAGGTQYVSSGGITHATTVSNGGEEIVRSGGSASGTMVSSGGILWLSAGGTADSATLRSGIEVLDPGGTDNRTIVSSGGIVLLEGTADKAILRGGEQDVLSGGTASGTIVSSGKESVSAGGIVDGATLSGGTLELGSGASAGSSTIVFAGGGTLKLEQSTAFHGKISGFGVPDRLDLADIAFGSGTSLSFVEAGDNLSGTLTVMNGAKTANLVLLGQYVAGDFHITSDSSASGAGTLVTDPPLLAGAADAGPGILAGPPHG